MGDSVTDEKIPSALPYDPPTVPGMFMHQAARWGDRVLHVAKANGVWTPSTWRQAYETLRRTTLGLAACGVARGDRVGIVSKTRCEWTEADMAILCAGAVTVGIYPTAGAWEMEHVLSHSGCRLLFVENDALQEKIEPIRRKLGLPERVVLFETGRQSLPAGVISFAEFKRMGGDLDRREPERFERAWRSVAPEDLATIAYTSGTTGPPKGVMITHANLYYTAIHAVETQKLDLDDFGIAYLPLTHMLQRVTVYAVMHIGIRGVYAESIDRLIDNFRELKPTVQVGVPRIFEKIHARIVQRVAAAPPLRRQLFAWAMGVGRKVSALSLAKRPLPMGLALSHAVADRLVLARIREIFGGKVKRLISGGAPMPLELLEFFHAAGLLILEGYGLTETVAPVSVNRPDDFKFGTVGRPIAGIEARLGEDGEILLRGQGLFKGYYRDPEATALAIDAEGWFHSGDIAQIDGEGFIRITDRKKDLIVTSGGKNIAPQNIESLITALPCISHAMVHGDRRRFLAALITLDEAEIHDFAGRDEKMGTAPDYFPFPRNGPERTVSNPEDVPAPKGTAPDYVPFARKGGEETETPALRPALLALITDHLTAVNGNLAPHERIRRFTILPSDFTEARAELTPTLKIRRREITRKYSAFLDSLYE
jgi:long-chain acyl-CoA synthetase